MVIMGGGNGAQAMAADLAAAGHDITLCELPDFGAAVDPIADSGEIELREGGSSHRVQVHATTDIAAATKNADLVHVVVPANGHDAFFEAMLPHLRMDQLVVIWSGRLGSLRLAHLADRREQSRPGIVEVNTLPYGARVEGPGRVRILYRASHLHFAALPTARDKRRLLSLESLYPGLTAAPHVLGVGLLNSSLLVLPTGTVLNAGGIDAANGGFFLFRDGLTPSVSRVVGSLNREFAAVGRAYGVSVPVYSEQVLEAPGSVESANFQGRSPDDYLAMAGPPRVDSRYLRENVPFGLRPIAGLARVAGVPCPVLEGIVALAGALCGGLEEGRTMAALGLEGLSCTEIIDLVTKGSE